MPGKLDIDSTEMITDGSAMQTCSEYYKSNVTEMFSVLSTLINSWTGQASDTYRDRFETRKPYLRELGDAVEGIAFALQRGGATFEATEEQLNAIVGRL